MDDGTQGRVRVRFLPHVMSICPPLRFTATLAPCSKQPNGNGVGSLLSASFEGRFAKALGSLVSPPWG